MSAYQDFLDFFSLRNKQRLDGLSPSYFTAMTPLERKMAFEYLLSLVASGGTEESVNGLFRADANGAALAVRRFLENGSLRGGAQIAAAWNLSQTGRPLDCQPIFIRHMMGSDPELREKAAYFVPSEPFTDELKLALRAMIRTETEQLARIHAVDKLMACYGATKEALGKDLYREIYRGLHSDDLDVKEATFRKLEDLG